MEINGKNLLNGQEVYACAYFFADISSTKPQKWIEPIKGIVKIDGHKKYLITNKKEICITSNYYYHDYIYFFDNEYECKKKFLERINFILFYKTEIHNKFIEFQKKQIKKYS